MLVKFKNEERQITTTGVVEQKLFKSGAAVGWLLSLTLADNLSSEELDSLLTEENIDEISLYNTTETDGVQEKELVTQFAGYEKVTSCLIRYTDNKQTIDIQLTKGV